MFLCFLQVFTNCSWKWSQSHTQVWQIICVSVNHISTCASPQSSANISLSPSPWHWSGVWVHPPTEAETIEPNHILEKNTLETATNVYVVNSISFYTGPESLSRMTDFMLALLVLRELVHTSNFIRNARYILWFRYTIWSHQSTPLHSRPTVWGTHVSMVKRDLLTLALLCSYIRMKWALESAWWTAVCTKHY